MKRIKSLSVLLISLSSLFTVQAQDDITNIFKAGVKDLNTVANGYLKPAANSFAIGLGSNWFNTADVHKVGGFDITVGAGVIQAPESDQYFDVSKLINLKPGAGVTQAPTFAGKGDGVDLTLWQPEKLANGQSNPLYGNKIVTFNTPQGVSKYIPTASLQLTVGLPFINDVSFRFIPKVSYDGFETSMWGIGIKHNFKRWIPGLKRLPIDAAIMLGYSKLNLDYVFSESARITPDKLFDNSQVNGEKVYVADKNSQGYENQKMKAEASAFSANIIVSKKLLFFTPYLGLGITRTNFDLTMAGNYPTLGDPVLENGKPKMQIVDQIDPVKIKSNELMTNATIGFRLKFFAIMALHAQYTFQKYPIASVGLGISIR